jgi:hypothetical protein
LLANYQVNSATIDGRRIMMLADDELKEPSEKELIFCIINKNQV